MDNTSKMAGESWSCCATCTIVHVLVIIGALNWGLTGVGMLMDSNWNVVNLLIGQWPMVEAIVYILVGLAGIMKIFSHNCACRTKMAKM